ncbi:bifunctional metallophosphatase/5'-nucleotidase [Vibrio sp. DW001]|uniref:bifunctional metallophosphatase/5'-nucleotidase n=1 Tax=Vibrio sp. DW001 TaxID=2912315 RepID=UPI0023B1D8BB|nr:bifunctional UDP-sugar hydrolase/5'-nucleotidase [Vibrio sp. DW001]WED29246.1 bifunctional metallophosphatase/5'-nucleotidase [Vibrio sp. DW001]
MTKKNKPIRLMLAHINDTHSYFEPQSLQLNLKLENQVISPYVSNGGFARIATRADELRQKALETNREFMFFHAGDCFQGTLFFSLFKGKANADLLNALNIDAMALGNHELDMGNQPVAEFLDRINFPILAGNWDISKESKQKRHPLKNKPNLVSYNEPFKTAHWITKEVQGELIAIFGVSMDQMADISNPDADTPFANTFETVQNTVLAIRRNGINKIILLSHLGIDVDLKLAKEVDGIAIIIGGHSHTLQGDFSSIGLENNGDYGVVVNQTRIVHSGLHAQAIGHCEIDFEADGTVSRFVGCNELLLGRRLCIDASLSEVNTDYLHKRAQSCLRDNPNVVICKKAPLVQSILQDKYIPQVRALQQTIIGRVTTPLRHVRIPDEIGGSDIVPIVAESFYHAMSNAGYSVEFGMHNAGGVRTSLSPGPISVADIAGKLLPFAVPIGVYHLKGKYLALVLEGAINNALSNGVSGTGTGSYPYCYNLDFIYDFKAKKGSRVTHLNIKSAHGGWKEVEDETIYCGTSSAYTMKGKEGFTAFLNMEDTGEVTQLSMADCFIELLKSQPDRLDNVVKQLHKLINY